MKRDVETNGKSTLQRGIILLHIAEGVVNVGENFIRLGIILDVIPAVILLQEEHVVLGIKARIINKVCRFLVGQQLLSLCFEFVICKA